jgi:putative molybdopterin biosynthesis protein
MERLRNGLVAHRHRHGLKQQDLADRAGITRQCLSTLEAGRSAPSTTVALRLAQALECHVEDLFWLEERRSSLVAQVAGAVSAPGNARSGQGSGRHRPDERISKGDRVVIGFVDDDWVAHRMAPEGSQFLSTTADGVVAAVSAGHDAERSSVTAKVTLFRDQEELRGSLLCAGCAPALGILGARVSERMACQRVVWLERSSSAALEMLRRGQVHIAGAHLFDEESGEFNVPFVQRLLPDRSMLVFNLVRWEAGLLVAPGNPRGIRGIKDLARPDVTIVPREPGAGAQRLLERMLGRAGVSTNELKRRGPVATGHLDVARAVALGIADVGVSIRPAALALGLGFLPLTEERFDLVVSKELSEDPRGARLLDALSSRPFRRELESIGGYGLSESGRLLARTHARDTEPGPLS